MKTYYIIAAVLLVATIGCNNKSEQLEKLNTELQAKNSELANDLSARDEYIDTVTQTINDIYSNLESVRSREGVVLKESNEIESKKKLTSRDIREKLLVEVSLIDSSLKVNRKRITDLQSKLNSAKKQYTGLKNMVAALKQTIEEREATIAQLEQKITALETEVSTKTQMLVQSDSVIQQQHGIIDAQHSEINRAYYIVGTRRELESKGVIAKQGGWLWGLLGSTTVLSSGIDSKYFYPIDKFQNTTIDISGKIDEIIPKRDETFYSVGEVSKNEMKLIISQPQSFWQDKYLVIITD